MTMMRKTITIPDAMEDWVKAQINSGRYGNDSEYFRDLIRRDQDRRLAKHELRLLIDEGLNCGISDNTVPGIVNRVENRLRQDGKYQLSNEADAEVDKLYEYSILNFGLATAREYVSSLYKNLMLGRITKVGAMTMGTLDPVCVAMNTVLIQFIINRRELEF